MREGQYRQTELTLTAAEANRQAFKLVLPIVVLYLVPYLLLWPGQLSFAAVEGFVLKHGARTLFYPFLMLLVFILGAVIHELLHGLTWAAFCKHGLKSISYGVHWQNLTPYCHCREVLPLRPYILGGLMPGLVMGLLPALAGMFTGKVLLFLFGLLFTLAASGDFLMLYMLRHSKATDLVQDHPDKMGCILYTSQG